MPKQAEAKRDGGPFQKNNACRMWDIATRESEVCDMKIEIAMPVVKGKKQFDVISILCFCLFIQ